MENKYIETHITSMMLYAENFKTACRLAALEDDGTVSRDEEKVLKKIEELTNEYIKKLKRL